MRKYCSFKEFNVIERFIRALYSLSMHKRPQRGFQDDETTRFSHSLPCQQ